MPFPLINRKMVIYDFYGEKRQAFVMSSSFQILVLKISSHKLQKSNGFFIRIFVNNKCA